MEFIFIIISWMILLVPGFDDSVPPTDDKIFKIVTSPDIVQSIKTKSDETFDFWGFDIELKQNSIGILDIKIPKNLPIPASITNSWNYDKRPLVLTDEIEINYDVVADIITIMESTIGITVKPTKRFLFFIILLYTNNDIERRNMFSYLV